MQKGPIFISDAEDLRRRAEERLAREDIHAQAAEDEQNLRLEHELQVQQIELELQNDELLKAQAENEGLLRQAITQYNDLYDFAPVGYATLGRDGAILLINLNGADLLGSGRSKLLNRRFGLFITPESRATFGDFLDKVFSSGKHETCELALLRREQTTGWAQLEAISKDGKTCWVVLLDISERKRAEQIQAARQRLLNFALSQPLLALLQETLNELEDLTGSQIGFYHFVEPDQHTVHKQAWSKRTLGGLCKAENAQGHYNLPEAGLWAECIRERRPVIHNDYAALPEARRKGLPEGHVLITREMIAPVLRGGLIVAIVGVGNKPEPYTEQDVASISNLADLAWEIADRKRAEEALVNARWRMENIIEGTDSGTWEWNVQTGETIFNEKWAQIIGYTLDELAPISIKTWVRLAHPDDLKQSDALLEKHFTGEFPGYHFESRMKHKDGYWVWVLDRGRVLTHSNDGKPLMMFGTHQDITERKRAEQDLLQAHAMLEKRVQERTAELSAANLHLEKAMRAKNEFLAMMSHELRTPLTGILGLSEIMQLPGSDPLTPKQSIYIAHIQNSGSQLLGMINEILDLSQLDAGKLDLIAGPCSLSELCKASLQTISAQAAAKNLRNSFTIEPDPILMRCDTRRLTQIVNNLLSNALKFTPSGGSFGIQASGDAQAGQVRITVWDTGIGIPAHDLPRLFQPFQQLDGRLSRNYNGSGLGLTLVKLLAELHGGSVQVESTVGQGSRFTVALPWKKT